MSWLCADHRFTVSVSFYLLGIQDRGGLACCRCCRLGPGAIKEASSGWSQAILDE